MPSLVKSNGVKFHFVADKLFLLNGQFALSISCNRVVLLMTVSMTTGTKSYLLW